MVKEWLCVLSREKCLKGTVVYFHRKWALMSFYPVTNGISEAKCRILRCFCVYVFFCIRLRALS